MRTRLFEALPGDKELAAELGLKKLSDHELQDLRRHLQVQLRVVMEAQERRRGTRIYDADFQSPIDKVFNGQRRRHDLFDHLRMEVDKDGKKEYTVDSYGFGDQECLALLSKIIDAGWQMSICGRSLWLPGTTVRLGFTPPEKAKC